MAFRDDHEAALARVSALERELAAKERELQTARNKRENADSVPSMDRPPLAEASEPRPGAGAVVAGIAGILIAAMVLAAWIEHRTDDVPTLDQPGSSAVANPACTLATDPPGATIFQRCENQAAATFNAAAARNEQNLPLPRMSQWTEVELGRTPLTLDRARWGTARIGCNGDLIARYPGRRDTVIAPPITDTGCSDRVVQLDAP